MNKDIIEYWVKEIDIVFAFDDNKWVEIVDECWIRKLEFGIVIFKIPYGVWLLMKRDRIYDWIARKGESRTNVTFNFLKLWICG